MTDTSNNGFHNGDHLLAVSIDIDTHEEPVVYMRSDCVVCRAEGFTANARLQVRAGGRSIVATLNIVGESVLPAGAIGFSRSAWRYLGPETHQRVTVRHAPVVKSLGFLRKKIHGHELNSLEISAIIHDISRRLYSDIEIAGFLTACAGGRLGLGEVIALTRAMVDTGSHLHWPDYPRVFDKHCVGGLPGNRTSPIVIAIASAAGLVLPKTSSRAITSPAGTADTMEVLTQVDLDLEAMRATVRRTGACLVWGGRVRLSPTDDLLIRIEKALDLDSDGQMVASVLSKKIAAGSTHILIDMPVGATAKIRTREQAQALSALFESVATALGVNVRCVVTDGSQTVGYGIGPAEEARDILAVLQNRDDAPGDLRERSVYLAANLLAMASGKTEQDALAEAGELLASGRAWEQFRHICEAQGGLNTIPTAAHSRDFHAHRAGTLEAMDNRRLAQLAKLAGAPNAPVAGLRLRVKVGHHLEKGAPLLTLYAATPGELAYASEYYRDNRDIFTIGHSP